MRTILIITLALVLAACTQAEGQPQPRPERGQTYSIGDLAIAEWRDNQGRVCVAVSRRFDNVAVDCDFHPSISNQEMEQ